MAPPPTGGGPALPAAHTVSSFDVGSEAVLQRFCPLDYRRLSVSPSMTSVAVI